MWIGCYSSRAVMRVCARASLERAAADGATRLPPALSPICAPAGGGLLLLRRSQSKCKCFCARDANGQSVDRVTLTQGAVAVAVATDALAVPSRPKASPSPTARQATALGLRCHAKRWPIESYAQKFDERAKSRSGKFLSLDSRPRMSAVHHLATLDRARGYRPSFRPCHATARWAAECFGMAPNVSRARVGGCRASHQHRQRALDAQPHHHLGDRPAERVRAIERS